MVCAALVSANHSVAKEFQPGSAALAQRRPEITAPHHWTLHHCASYVFDPNKPDGTLPPVRPLVGASPAGGSNEKSLGSYRIRRLVAWARSLVGHRVASLEDCSRRSGRRNGNAPDVQGEIRGWLGHPRQGDDGRTRPHAAERDDADARSLPRESTFKPASPARRMFLSRAQMIRNSRGPSARSAQRARD